MVVGGDAVAEQHRVVADMYASDGRDVDAGEVHRDATDDWEERSPRSITHPPGRVLVLEKLAAEAVGVSSGHEREAQWLRGDVRAVVADGRARRDLLDGDDSVAFQVITDCSSSSSRETTLRAPGAGSSGRW